jgi:plasmid stability protein
MTPGSRGMNPGSWPLSRPCDRPTPSSVLTSSLFLWQCRGVATLTVHALTELRIGNLDDWVIAALQSQARRRGRSLDAELCAILRDEAVRSKRQVAAEHQDRLDRLRDKYGTFSDSAALIREMRDERG